MHLDSLEGAQILIKTFSSSEYHFPKFDKITFSLHKIWLARPLSLFVISLESATYVEHFPCTNHDFKMCRTRYMDAKTGSTAILKNDTPMMKKFSWEF